MATATESLAGDPRLHAFLQADSEANALTALDALLGGETERVVRETVQHELGGTPAATLHLDDVVSDVRLRLVRKLWSLRRGAGDAIDNFLGYAAVTAEHACYALLRLQHPNRTRFRNRVRYVAGHHAGTTLTQRSDGVWVCGTRRAVRAITPGSARRFFDNPVAWLAWAQIDSRLPLPVVVDTLLARVDQPIELDRLVDALVVVFGITDAQFVSPQAEAPHPIDRVPDPTPGASDVLEQRGSLSRVWTEIVALPPRQRAALLLNLRDPEGGAVLQLLPATGVVSRDGIAAALEMDAARLAELWDELPLEDRVIAAQLAITRQQVINLRKSARARLARRLRGERL